MENLRTVTKRAARPHKEISAPQERKTARARFTIIELLVVIAIITILASLLLPVLSMAKEQSKRVQCLGNERQIGLAIFSYAGDYGDWLPCLGTDNGNYTITFSLWNDNPGAGYYNYCPLGLLAKDWKTTGRGKYLNNLKSYFCPSATGVALTTKTLTNAETKFEVPNKTGALPHYVLNSTIYYDLSLPYADRFSSPFRRLSKAPPDLLLMADQYHDLNLYSSTTTISHSDKKGLPAGFNVLFVDGSASWVKNAGYQIANPNTSSAYYYTSNSYHLS